MSVSRKIARLVAACVASGALVGGVAMPAMAADHDRYPHSHSDYWGHHRHHGYHGHYGDWDRRWHHGWYWNRDHGRYHGWYGDRRWDRDRDHFHYHR